MATHEVTVNTYEKYLREKQAGGEKPKGRLRKAENPMGTRVEFWRGAHDGLLGHFLASPLPSFYTWYQEELREEPNPKQEPVLALIGRVVEQGEAALEIHSSKDAWYIDRMMDLFTSYYCDAVRPELMLEAGGSMFNVRNYQNREFVSKRYGPQARRLWDFLLDGRGVGRPDDMYPYQSEYGTYRLSFWTYDEVDFFRQCLEKFGTGGSFWRPKENDISVALSTVESAIENVSTDGLGLIITVA